MCCTKITKSEAFQTLKPFNLELSNFQNLKLSNSKVGGLSNFRARRISSLQDFETSKPSNSQTRVSYLRTFELQIFQYSKPSNFQALDLNGQPGQSQTEHEEPTLQTPNVHIAECASFKFFEEVKRSISKLSKPSNLRTFKV